MKILLIISALSVLLFVGCGKSAPSCTDESVKNMVVDISIKEIKNQIFSERFEDLRNYGLTYDKFNKDKEKPGNESKNEIISSIDQQVAAMKINLTDIRINERRDDIKKSYCGGNLVLSNEKSLSVTYSAQYTENGKVYVEVSMLK